MNSTADEGVEEGVGRGDDGRAGVVAGGEGRDGGAGRGVEAEEGLLAEGRAGVEEEGAGGGGVLEPGQRVDLEAVAGALRLRKATAGPPP